MTNLVAALVLTLATNFQETVTERAPVQPISDWTCGQTNCGLCYAPGAPIAKDVVEIISEVRTGQIGEWTGETRKEIRRTNYLARLDWVKSEKPDPFAALRDQILTNRGIFMTNNMLPTITWSNHIHDRPVRARR